MRVKIVYLRPERVWIRPLTLPEGATVREALEQSGVLTRFPEIQSGRGAVGIFGRVVPETRILRDGDRVEIYRPLLTDPKQRRRQRAASR